MAGFDQWHQIRAFVFVYGGRDGDDVGIAGFGLLNVADEAQAVVVNDVAQVVIGYFQGFIVGVGQFAYALLAGIEADGLVFMFAPGRSLTDGLIAQS